MKGCKDCTNAIFEEKHGDYKCKVHKRYIYDVDKQRRCPFWKRGKVQINERKDKE